MVGSRGPGLVIQERDRRLLAELELLRVVNREQAERVAGFGSITRANVRLLALTRTGFLKRAFVGTIAGGRKAVYTATAKGAAMVASERSGLSLQQGTLTGNLNLEHQLKINSIYIAFKYPKVPVVGASLLRWISFRKALTEAVPLIPDGYFELQLRGNVDPAFLEVDMGTETQAIWKTKVEQYIKLAVSGTFARLFGRKQFRVFVVAAGDKRLENIRKTIAGITEKLFFLSSFEAIVKNTFWSQVWLRAKGTGNHFPF